MQKRTAVVAGGMAALGAVGGALLWSASRQTAAGGQAGTKFSVVGAGSISSGAPIEADDPAPTKQSAVGMVAVVLAVTAPVVAHLIADVPFPALSMPTDVDTAREAVNAIVTYVSAVNASVGHLAFALAFLALGYSAAFRHGVAFARGMYSGTPGLGFVLALPLMAAMALAWLDVSLGGTDMTFAFSPALYTWAGAFFGYAMSRMVYLSARGARL